MGKITATNGTLRMDQISRLVQNGVLRNLDRAVRPKGDQQPRWERSVNDLERASLSSENNSYTPNSFSIIGMEAS
jgi:hypothetical protein